jgi:hypothetical protein
MEGGESPQHETVTLAETRKKARESGDLDALRALSDHSLKHWILVGFFVCSAMGLFSASVKFYQSDSTDSTRESAGLITTIMSGITGIAAGVFTGSALR